MRQIEVINQETIIDVTAETSNVEILVRDYDSELVERFALEAQEAAIDAEESADIATAQASIATAQATIATTQAGIATTQAGIATTQAGIATTKANEASASAASALASEQAADADRIAAQAAASTSTTQAGIATTQAGIATTKAGEASDSAAAALASETDAETAASTATTQAGIATTQAGIATTQAGIATTQASNALTSANNAAASAAAAAQVGTSTPLTGFSTGANSTILATDTILQGFNKTQGQINARVSGTIATGQVAFGTAANTVGGDNGLFWDNTNKRLGIGTNAPSQRFSVFGATTTIPNNSTWVTAGNPISSFYGEGASGNMDFFIGGASNISIARPVLIGRKSSGTLGTPTAVVNGNSIFSFLSSAYSGTQFLNTASINMIVDGTVNTTTVPQAITFETGTTSRTERLRINSNGNLLINTTTDAGFRLDVNGTARVQGDATITGNLTVDTNSLFVNASNNRIGIGTITPAVTFDVVGTHISGTGIARFRGSSVSGFMSLDTTSSGESGFLLKSANTLIGQVGIDGDLNELYFKNRIFADIKVLTINSSGNLVISNSSNVLIGTTTDVASSKLTIESTTQGVLFPRMTTTQKNAIASPAEGLVVYDTTLNKLSVRGALTWETITSL
jgi:hypothetical protein